VRVDLLGLSFTETEILLYGFVAVGLSWGFKTNNPRGVGYFSWLAVLVLFSLVGKLGIGH
jgi:hypothetical protein